MVTTVWCYTEKAAVLTDNTWQHETGCLLLREGMKTFGINGSIGLEGTKPVFFPPNGYYFNISHSGECVAVVLSDCPVGLDVEKRRSVREATLEKALSEQERCWVRSEGETAMAFLRLWTLKESYGKAFGFGMHYPMREIEFFAAGENRTVKESEGEPLHVACSDDGVDCFQWMAQERVISLCVRGKLAIAPRLILVDSLKEVLVK